jgi:maleylacetoacetate isomerase
MTAVTLYSYFRSSCSWRVRIALNLLNVPHTIHPVNLLKNEQRSDWYLRINPLGTVPSLFVPGMTHPIWQSLAIIDFLDKSDSLMPQDPADRARCMQIALTIVSEIQPLQNLSVINKVAELAGGGEDGNTEKLIWIQHHNRSKLKVIEDLVSDTTPFTVSDQVCLSDICLIPQLYSAERFGINLGAEFPRLLRVARKLERIDAFERAHAHSQVDCPEELSGSIYFS